jgi:uncharacterized membrane protein YjdF
MEKRFFQLDKIEKFRFVLTSLIRITLIIATVLAIYERNWMVLFVIIITFFLTFLPIMFEKKYKIDLPAEFEIIIILFIYAGIFLGGPRNFYNIFWWWDSLLHFFSGVALGFAGFLILYVFYKRRKLNVSPRTIAIFAFCFALALGVIWEIFEFNIDIFLGYNMQEARYFGTLGLCDTWLGVKDTMIDLILDAIGALIASISGYFYLKKGERGILNYFIKKFEKINPLLFKTRLDNP